MDTLGADIQSLDRKRQSKGRAALNGYVSICGWKCFCSTRATVPRNLG